MAERIRILGIDPGSRLTGFGVVDCAGDTASYVASGRIRSIDGDFPGRLRQLFAAMTDVASEYRPDSVAVESVFMHRNAASALKLGHARSAAICATFSLQVDIAEYAPREVKQAIVGTGGASKEQVQHMIRQLLQLDAELLPDVADALAVALCHAHQRRALESTGRAALAAGLK